MTRKDYILIAEALRNRFSNAETDEQRETIAEVTDELSNSLKYDNPRFDRQHFSDVVRGKKDLHSRPSRNGRQS